MPDPYNPWATPIFPGDNAQQPYESYASPQIANILSHIAGALGRGFMAPGQALQSTTPITSEQMVGPAHDMMGVMVGGVPMAEKGAAGVFGGRLAQTADQGALAKAEQLHAAGAPREQIWNDTGWFKGTDDKWRFEIPDNASSFNKGGMADRSYNVLGNEIIAKEGPASGVMNHPELYRAYPDKQFMTVGELRDATANGVYHPPGSGMPEMMALNLGYDAGHSTMLHEMQHAIQNSEGFIGGANSKFAPKVPNPDVQVFENAIKSHPDMIEYMTKRASPEYQRELSASNNLWKAEYEPRIQAIDDLSVSRAARADLAPKVQEVFRDFEKAAAGQFPTMARVDDLANALKSQGIPRQRPKEMLDPHEVYRRNPGEVEARNVQTRQNMTTDQLRATPPWLTQDVPDALQIYRGSK